MLLMPVLVWMFATGRLGNKPDLHQSGMEIETRSHSSGSSEGGGVGPAKLSVREPNHREEGFDQLVGFMIKTLDAEGLDEFRVNRMWFLEAYRDPLIWAEFLNQIPDEEVRYNLSSLIVADCSPEPENLLVLASKLDDPYLALRAKQRWAIEQVRREADPVLILDMIASLDDPRERRVVAGEFEGDVNPRMISDDYYHNCLAAVMGFPQLHDVIDVKEVQGRSVHLDRRKHPNQLKMGR
jgi:hypothetical protein